MIREIRPCPVHRPDKTELFTVLCSQSIARKYSSRRESELGFECAGSDDGTGEYSERIERGDDGIDGIVHEDKLGFNLIYIQAKRWKPDTTIGKPELQKFAGAMMGPPRVDKGLFITTAKFSPKAKEYANAQHIILVDGEKLTNLMIEHGVGVSTQKTYLIKRIDSDYFSEND